MTIRNQLDIYIRARYPLLWVVTPEERRALREIEELALEQRKPLQLWSSTVGLVNSALPTRVDSTKRDPLGLLSSILDDGQPGLWVLRDFHPFLRDPTVVRRLRETAFGIEASAKTVILLSPVLKIPPELEKEITVVDFDQPTSNELSRLLDSIVNTSKEREAIEVILDRRERGRLVRACLGLTASEAENAVAKAIVQANGRLDRGAIETVTAEKQQILSMK